MTERILVVDPGERVGWCHADIVEKVRPVPRQSTAGYVNAIDTLPLPSETFQTENFYDVEVTGHGITPAWDFVTKLGEVIANYDTVIYETYRIYAHLARQHIGSDVPTAQIVGVIRYLAMLNPKVKLVGQGATCMTTGEKVAPSAIREVLERLPKSHDEAHDGSALRHLAFYWFKNYAG